MRTVGGGPGVHAADFVLACSLVVATMTVDAVGFSALLGAMMRLNAPCTVGFLCRA